MARGAWSVELKDSVEFLARANTLSDVAICEGSWLYMEGCGWRISELENWRLASPNPTSDTLRLEFGHCRTIKPLSQLSYRKC